MHTKKIKNIPTLLKTSSTLGLPSLVVVESDADGEKVANVAGELTRAGFSEAKNYMGIMSALEKGDTSVFYVEKGEKLDSLVLEIVAEYTTGMASLADREGNTGLKTVRFSPFRSALAVIMTREQVEQSNQNLFEYFGVKESIS